jgi:hypothetical protein
LPFRPRGGSTGFEVSNDTILLIPRGCSNNRLWTIRPGPWGPSLLRSCLQSSQVKRLTKWSSKMNFYLGQIVFLKIFVFLRKSKNPFEEGHRSENHAKLLD